MRRRRRHPRHEGVSRFAAGLIAIALVAVGTALAFTKANPFTSPHELRAVFRDARNLNPRSPVRIAGVEVGTVKSVEPRQDGAATVTMEIEDEGLPIHADATLKVRPRIFLEGNFFVDLRPGSPSAPVLEEGESIGPAQTAAPVQFGDLLAALQSDTREDLQVLLAEYAKALEGDGAEGLNEALRSGGDALRNLAITSEAGLGEQPTADVRRLLQGQADVSRALISDERALKGLVTDLNVTAAALAREDGALGASVPALRDTLRVGLPALRSINSALPSVRAFAADALPGVRSTAPTLRAALPFVRQARLLVSPAELGGAARELRVQVPPLTLLNRLLVPLLGEARGLSSCTSNVLVPWARSPIPNPDEPDNDDQPVYRQFNRGLVGLAGESRLSDANSSYFHTSAVPGVNPLAGVITVRPAPPADLGDQPPPRRPDVPCETQEPPNMSAPGGPLTRFTDAGRRGGLPQLKTKATRRAGVLEAGRGLRKYERTTLAERKRRFARGLKRLAAEAKR